MRTTLLLCFLSYSIIACAKNDRDLIKEIDQSNTLALQYKQKGHILESFKVFLEAKKLSDSINDYYGIATASYNIGDIHFSMNNTEDAKTSYHHALSAAKKINNDLIIAGVYLNLAQIFNKTHSYTEVNSFLANAIRFSEEKNYHSGADILGLRDIALQARILKCKLSLDQGDLDEALLRLLKAEAFIENTDDFTIKSHYNYIYGTYFLKKELYNQACHKFDVAISLLNDTEISNYKLLSEIYHQLSIAHAKSGRNEEAYATLLKSNSFRSKFLNEDKLKQEVFARYKYTLEDYKNDIEEANQENLELIKLTDRLKMVNIAIMVMLALLFASLARIGYSFVINKKLSKKLKFRNNELETARNEALKSSKLKSKFISNVSHELRTPLYGVVGITSLLLENSNLDEKDRSKLKSLKYSGDYLLNLINDILQIGKIEQKEIKLKESSVNLNSLFENIVNSFESRLVETNNKINIHIDEQVPQHIKCDKVRLSQIIFNLVGNSIKFTQDGTIDLRVKFLELIQGKVRLAFEVEDSGVGIPKDKFETIFDVFSQLDKSNFNYQGTGLGLSITKNLIELFDSQIEVESEEGKGSKFKFEIEFNVDIAEQNNSAKKAVKRALLNKNNNYTILVAEDNKINQIVTKNLLEKQHYKCVIVNNGKEAVEEISKNKDKYDLILMDINMPIMNGNEATPIIRELNSKIPVVALTAADIEEVKNNYESIGYCDIITKPFDNYEFFQTIASHIHNSKRGGNVKLTIAS
ncbi:ATP-binding protein [Flavobacteriaceae bacterium MHTCC 0001]